MNEWKTWEIDILLDDYEEHGVAHVVARTGRSRNAVMRKAWSFSLKVREPKYRSGGYSHRVGGRFAKRDDHSSGSGSATLSTLAMFGPR